MVDVLKEKQRGGETLLQSIETINERDGGLIEAMVPVSLINREEIAVNEFHVNELVDSMLSESTKGIANGQLTPILLAQIEGNPTFSIIDGFHRDAALSRSGKEKIFATVRLNTTQEEVDDLRILTASSHSSVAFSRIVEWVGSAWDRTEWSETVTAAQAFSLANSKAMTGARMGLNEDSAAAIREWALDKCTRWRIAPGTIYQNMATAQLADPELVTRARQRESGHRLDELTPDHLKYIARAYPNKSHEQKNVATIVTDNNLTIAETKLVLDILGTAEHDDMITEIIELTDWKKMIEKDSTIIRKRQKHVEETDQVSVSKANDTPRTKRASYTDIDISTRDKGASIEFKTILDVLTSTQVELARTSLKNLILNGQYTPVRVSGDLQSPFVAKNLPDAITESLVADVSAVPDILQMVSDDALKPLIRSTMLKNNLDEDTADYIVKEAFHRVARDSEEGSLRFAFPKKKEHILIMLNRAINDEVAQLNDPNHGPSPVTPQRIVNFSEIITTMPTLHPIARTALTLYGVMNAPRQTVQQVLRLNNGDIEKLENSLTQRLI